MRSIPKWLTRIALAFVSLLFFLSLWLYYAFDYKPKREAKKAIEEFHQRFNNADVTQDCKDGTGPRLDECVASMREIQELLGKFKYVKSSKIRCEVGPAFFCLAAYASSFEKGDTTELLTLNAGTGQYRLFEYSVLIDGKPFPPRQASMEKVFGSYP